MANTTEKLESTLSEYDSKFNQDDVIKKYESYSNEFEELVSKGLAKKRGNNTYSPI